jgi:hypothetical protein
MDAHTPFSLIAVISGRFLPNFALQRTWAVPTRITWDFFYVCKRKRCVETNQKRDWTVILNNQNSEPKRLAVVRQSEPFWFAVLGVQNYDVILCVGWRYTSFLFTNVKKISCNSDQYSLRSLKYKMSTFWQKTSTNDRYWCLWSFLITEKERCCCHFNVQKLCPQELSVIQNPEKLPTETLRCSLQKLRLAGVHLLSQSILDLADETNHSRV